MSRLLLVEDNPMNAKLAERRLRRQGFEVEWVADGLLVQERALAFEPDAVLMDLSLPGRDGLDCTRALKSDPRTADVPVVAVTAHALRGDRERALAAGCVAYVTKPLDFGALLGVLKEALGSRGE